MRHIAARSRPAARTAASALLPLFALAMASLDGAMLFAAGKALESVFALR